METNQKWKKVFEYLNDQTKILNLEYVQKISENKFFILKPDLINEIKWLELTNLVIIKIKILDDFL